MPDSVDVCAVEALAMGEVAVVTVSGVGRVAVFHADDGLIYGIEDRCSHQAAYLSDGFLDGCAVECPLHSSMFDLRTGKPDGPPAMTPLRTFAAARVGERIVVYP